MYRRKADKIIDRAHSRICDAEMRILHSFTEVDMRAALDELAAAQRYLARAISTRDAWDAVSHDDYEEYPDVPEQEQHHLGV